MLNALARAARQRPGWLAASLKADGLEFVHGVHVPSGRSAIKAYGVRPLAGAHSARRLAKEMGLKRYRCTTFLQPAEYQLLLVESPGVDAGEVKSALRWRIKDLLDYPVDQAMVDVLAIPGDGATAGRFLYAVAAKSEVIHARMQAFAGAAIPLSVIDIAETAQRNLAALAEEPGEALALVYFGEDWGLLTINFRGELYFARRLEVGVRHVVSESEAPEEVAVERIAVELQRSFDHFERQFRSVPVTRLLVAPTPRGSGLKEALQSRLGIACENLEVGKLLDFDGGSPERETQWRFFHHFGAALRDESTTS